MGKAERIIPQVFIDIRYMLLSLLLQQSHRSLISYQPGTPASAWSVVPRALCRSDICPSRLCSRTVSIQSGGALDQSDLCTCRIRRLLTLFEPGTMKEICAL